MKSKEKVSLNTQISIVAIALITFSGILSETSMNVTFNTLQKVFQTDLGTLQWITSGYLLAVAITITLGATLAHNWTERRILFTAAIGFLVGNAMAALAPNFAILMCARIIQGAATGLAVPLLFNVIVERVPRSQIGLYMGFSGLVISLAPAIGPTYGGFMIHQFDWHMIFALILIFPLLSLILGYFFLENGGPKEPRPFDLLAFLLLATALTSAIMAISSLESGQIDWLLLGLFVISLTLFIWRSLRSEKPFLDIRLLGNPVILLGILPFFIYQFSNLSSNFLLPNYLTMVNHASTTQAGFALLPGTLLGALAAPFLGNFYDRFGPKPSLYGGNILFLLAILALVLFSQQLTVTFVIAVYIVFTIGRNMAFNNTMAVSVSNIKSEQTADATALFQTAQTFAGALGTAIAALLVKQAPTMETGANHVFVLLSILVAGNFLFFQQLFRRIRSQQADKNMVK